MANKVARCIKAVADNVVSYWIYSKVEDQCYSKMTEAIAFVKKSCYCHCHFFVVSILCCIFPLLCCSWAGRRRIKGDVANDIVYKPLSGKSYRCHGWWCCVGASVTWLKVPQLQISTRYNNGCCGQKCNWQVHDLKVWPCKRHMLQWKVQQMYRWHHF